MLRATELPHGQEVKRQDDAGRADAPMNASRAHQLARTETRARQPDRVSRQIVCGKNNCAEWRNTFREEPTSESTEHTERLLVARTIPAEELKRAPQIPHPVGPIVLWHAAMVTNHDLMLVEFGRDREHWTIKQRSKHYLWGTKLLQNVIPIWGINYKIIHITWSHFDNSLFLYLQNSGVFMYADRSDSRFPCVIL